MNPKIEEVSKTKMLLSVAETAETLGVHRATVYDLIGRGALSTVKIGRRRLVSPDALEDFIRASERSGL